MHHKTVIPEKNKALQSLQMSALRYIPDLRAGIGIQSNIW